MRTQFWKIAGALALGLGLMTTQAMAGDTYYKYDALGRVLLSSYPDGSQVGFAYDSAGNRSATKRAIIAPPTTTSTLASGKGLIIGAMLTSPNLCYSLVLQEDGNLVLYRNGVGAKWSSNTSGMNSASLVMQTDGNAVLSGPTETAGYWNSVTAGHAGAYMSLQNDGNLVIYQGSTALWSSNTALGAC